MNYCDADAPAMPMVVPEDWREKSAGITKREYFAAMAMQGYCTEGVGGQFHVIAEQSVRQADALIEALNKVSK